MQTKPSLKVYGQVKFFGTFDGFNWWLTDSPTSIYGAIVATEYLPPFQLNPSSGELECLARYLGSNIRSGLPVSCLTMRSTSPTAFEKYQEYLQQLPDEEGDYVASL